MVIKLRQFHEGVRVGAIYLCSCPGLSRTTGWGESLTIVIEPVLSSSEVNGYSFRSIPLDVERFGSMLIDSNTRIVAIHPTIRNTPSSTTERTEPKEVFPMNI
jgi:hypothetical protein